MHDRSAAIDEESYARQLVKDYEAAKEPVPSQEIFDEILASMTAFCESNEPFEQAFAAPEGYRTQVEAPCPSRLS